MFIGAQVAGQVENFYTLSKSKKPADIAKSTDLEAKIKAIEDTKIKPAQDKIDELMGLTGKAPHERFLIQLTGGSGKNGPEIAALNQELAKYREERSQFVIQRVQWRQVWTFPAVFAGIIMVLFVLVFRDNGTRGSTDTSAKEFPPAGH